MYSTAHKADVGRPVMADDAVSFEMGTGEDTPTLLIRQDAIMASAVVASGQLPAMSVHAR
jgi:hypothetical protein